jgi:hypothetical protein
MMASRMRQVLAERARAARLSRLLETLLMVAPVVQRSHLERKFAPQLKALSALASNDRNSNRNWYRQAVKPHSYSRTCTLSS